MRNRFKPSTLWVLPVVIVKFISQFNGFDAPDWAVQLDDADAALVVLIEKDKVNMHMQVVSRSRHVQDSRNSAEASLNLKHSETKLRCSVA